MRKKLDTKSYWDRGFVELGVLNLVWAFLLLDFLEHFRPFWTFYAIYTLLGPFLVLLGILILTLIFFGALGRFGHFW